ncbi:MAG: winged helix-turn-helix transcriptional regulator [Methanolobus sp.]|uniref:winged helix-turn-helix transcriptional regulator n=1 Tax=Methanolobus sp. TaxID=1874737 RepID=UPI00272FDD89|nr:winged helix-turn-helix transcriptional regulator [Methanolobus sp.]MDP2215886.1 winged helix-turn-helix transcriptional regulator [Methanolobus sp.]
MAEDSIDELLRWIVSVERRVILIDYLKEHSIAKASDIAHKTNRSTQNISRALKEYEDRGIIECLTPGKTTWKRYVLTAYGKTLIQKWKENNSGPF